MEPRAVRTKQQLVRPRTLSGLDDVVKTLHTRGVSIDIRVAHQLVNDPLLNLPVIPKAAQMRDDEIHLPVLWREHLNHLSPINHINLRKS